MTSHAKVAQPAMQPTRHAMAMVRWEVFRRGQADGRRLWLSGQQIFDYASRQARLTRIVGDSGTLWLVTSRRTPDGNRRYHLAYKLVGCRRLVEGDETVSSPFGPFVVRGDMKHSRHYSFNDVTATLQQLTFRSGRALKESSSRESSSPGLRLLSIPELATEDIDIMMLFEHRLDHNRHAFVSYARGDVGATERLERGLEPHGIHISRDVHFLEPGAQWAAALHREARSCDCVIVMVSQLAATSEWVQREVAWALKEFDAGGFVKRIVPLVLATGGWERFPELHRFQRCDWPRRPDARFFASLARGVAEL